MEYKLDKLLEEYNISEEQKNLIKETILDTYKNFTDTGKIEKYSFENAIYACAPNNKKLDYHFCQDILLANIFFSSKTEQEICLKLFGLIYYNEPKYKYDITLIEQLKEIEKNL